MPFRPLSPAMVLRVRRRTRLRRKEADTILSRLNASLGMAIPLDDTPVDEAEAGDVRLVFRRGESLAFLVGEDVAPTVRGLLAFPARRRHVTVDMGAVAFVYNGADVMAPGIVDADSEIRAGDIVWVRDEKNGRPLAVGRALVDGPSMATERRGKAIESLHHVGDDIWRVDEET